MLTRGEEIRTAAELEVQKFIKKDREFEDQQDAFHIRLEQLRAAVDGSAGDVLLEWIDTNDNIRSFTSVDPEMQTLMASMKESGLLQLPVVTIQEDTILCISGHRRIEAAKQLGWEKIKCVVRKIDSEQAKRLMQISENNVRQSMTPLELAEAIFKVRDETRYSNVRLGELLGFDESYVRRLCKIAVWPHEAKEIIREAPDSFGAKVLVSLAAREMNDAELLNQLMNRTTHKPKRDSKKKRVENFLLETKLEASELELLRKFVDYFEIKGFAALFEIGLSVK